jgi:hypothetical protein
MDLRRGRWLAIAVAIGLVAGCGGGGADSGDGAGSEDAARDAGGVGALAAPGAPDTSVAEEGAGSDAGEAAPGRLASVAAATRSIVYRVDLTVETEDVTGAARRAASLADTSGGFVESESTSGDGTDDGPRTSTLVLRVPVDRYGAVVDDLSALGTVVYRERSSEDVTEEVVDVDARIESQQASLTRLRQLLDDAESLADVVALEREIAAREAELDSLTRRQQQLAGLTELATVGVTFTAPGTAIGLADDPPDRGFLAGLERGWEAFTAAFAVALTVLGAAVPFVALALLVAVPVGWALRGRRRRAAAPAEPTATEPERVAEPVP